MSSVDANTPNVVVLDNRGLSIREIVYHRHPDNPGAIEERITRHTFDARGAQVASADPRLYAAGKLNFRYISDLTGNALLSEGVDNGKTVNLNDAARRPILSVTADGVVQRIQYEASDLPGRPLSMSEESPGKAACITDRFVYAGNSDAEKSHNLAGACISHYDVAGLQQTGSISLAGTPLSVTRRLLKDADNPDTTADWQGADASAWNDLLGAEDFITSTTTDATGEALTTTDAKGNMQRVAYDVAGQLKRSWLTIEGRAEQVIVKSLSYSAAGQKLQEVHGNGVVTSYTYEAETQRLIRIKRERPDGHSAGVKVLQDLRYQYDPVGNVLAVTNDAEETRFWRNQKVMPESTYLYDSLYQLISATGREMAGAGQQGSQLPAISSFDSATYTHYTRTYHYDSAGNLTRIRHSAPATGNSYTTEMTVSDRSNRAVTSVLTAQASDVDSLFTAGGQQKQLMLGQQLTWTARNELLKVSPVIRDGSTDDWESYRYDSRSQRVMKSSQQKTAGSIRTQRVIYLPGLELRTVAADATQTEGLEIINFGEAGDSAVRILVWTTGKPDGIDNGQVRYSYNNLTGSSGLEVDAEGRVISMEEFYPYGGTALLVARSQTEVDYKTIRYSGKERDATGLYYYGYRYYQPWAGRWLSADPAETVDGLNLFRMCRNNPVSLRDNDGRSPQLPAYFSSTDPIVIGEDGLTSTDKRSVTEIKNDVSTGLYRMDDVRDLFSSPSGLNGTLKNTSRYPDASKNNGWQRAEAITKNELRVVSQLKNFQIGENSPLYRGLDVSQEEYDKIIETKNLQNTALSFFSNNAKVAEYFTGRREGGNIKKVIFVLKAGAEMKDNYQLREGRIDVESYRKIFNGKTPEGIKEIIALPGNVFELEDAPSAATSQKKNKSFKVIASRLFKKDESKKDIIYLNIKPVEYVPHLKNKAYSTYI